MRVPEPAIPYFPARATVGMSKTIFRDTTSELRMRLLAQLDAIVDRGKANATLKAVRCAQQLQIQKLHHGRFATF
jgi:hypothetical protein